jgi:hypothetical protein
MHEVCGKFLCMKKVSSLFFVFILANDRKTVLSHDFLTVSLSEISIKIYAFQLS